MREESGEGAHSRRGVWYFFKRASNGPSWPKGAVETGDTEFVNEHTCAQAMLFSRYDSYAVLFLLKKIPCNPGLIKI